MAQSSLIAAVVNRVRAQVPDLAQKFWFGEVPEENAFPFGELAWPRTVFEETFESTYVAQPLQEITCFAHTAEQAESLAWQCFEALVWQALSFGPDPSIEIRPTDFFVARVPSRESAGERVFGARLVVRIRVRRTHAA